MANVAFNRFSKLRTKKFAFLNHLNFLLLCKRNNRIPNFISRGLSCKLPDSKRISKTFRNCCFSMLRAVIQDTRSLLSCIESELYNLHLQLANSTCNFSVMDSRSWNRAQYSSDKQRRRQALKFSKLASTLHPPVPNLCSSEPIINISGLPLTDVQERALTYNFNFAQSCTPSIPALLAPIEKSFKFSKISASQKDTLRHLLSHSIATNFPKKVVPNLPRPERSALKELLNNDKLCITRADKGGQIVVLTKHQYLHGTHLLLESGPYKTIPKDPSEKLRLQHNNVIKSSSLLSPRLKKLLFVSHANPARLYALPKVHKPNTPFRPIISCIDTVPYKLAKFLVAIFSPLSSANSHTCSNSFDFITRLHTVSPENCTIASLDIKSMFTNVPVDGALDCLRTRLSEFHFAQPEIAELVNLTSLCVNFNYFTFNGQLFQQTAGLAMGNPLSPLLCDFYMHYFEDKLFDVIQFKLWVRYVDDIFIVWDGSPDQLSSTLPTINSLDTWLDFSLEIEKDNSLPFLDVLVKKVGDRFETSVFRKPFAVALPPHRKSCHPLQQKLAAFYTYVHRALRICSSDHEFHQEIAFLKSIAVNRGYSAHIIDSAIAKFTKRKPHSTLSKLLTPVSSNTIVIPFFPKVSVAIAKILRQANFKVIFSPVNKIPPSKLKDNVPDSRRWGIYQAFCQCGLSYIGQTKRALSQRLKEHQRYVEKAEFHKSSIAVHCHEYNHKFNFADARIIFQPRSPFELDFVEAYFIQKFSSSIVNDHKSSPFFNSAWTKLLSSLPQA